MLASLLWGRGRESPATLRCTWVSSHKVTHRAEPVTPLCGDKGEGVWHVTSFSKSGLSAVLRVQ